MKNNKWLYALGVLLIVIVFFVISRNGFFSSDDWAMGVGLNSIREALLATANFYKSWGGGVFGTFSQYLFCGLLGNDKIWFDLANTIIFLLFLLVCGKLVCGANKSGYWKSTLLFSLLFWFFCPKPSETLFWPVGSMGYLWTSMPVLLFIWLYNFYKDVRLPLPKTLALSLFSALMATSISCISICGAMVLYYLFNYKKLNRSVLFMFTGFLLGSVFLVFAPGNFARAGVNVEFDWITFVKGMFSPVKVLAELAKYKALWLFVVALVLFFVKNRIAAKNWCRNNLFMLLALGISLLCFSVVFAPYISSNRSLLFPEVLSIILSSNLVINAFSVCYFNSFKCVSTKVLGNAALILLFVLLVVDGYKAIEETKRQNENNDRLLAEIYKAGGVVSVDVPKSSHRMAFAPLYPQWAWEGMALKMGLDSVHVYPYYCQDKYFEEPLRFGENIYVDKVGVYDSQGMVVIRYPEDDSLQGFVCRIDYERPKKWYRLLIDRLRHYQYKRYVEVDFFEPELSYQGYDYYLVWMSTEDCWNIRKIRLLNEYSN